MVAEGLAALINSHVDLKVVGNAGTVAECVPAAAELGPDVVLLDFRLPDGTGAEAAAAVRKIRPEAKLIFLTREDSDLAIRDVARGRMLITPRTIAALLSKRRASDAQLDSLKSREKEVLRLMADGP